MSSLQIEGVRFVAYPQDHEPRHLHCFAGEAEVIVDLRQDGSVALADRADAIRPGNAKRSDVRRALVIASATLKPWLRSGRACMNRIVHRVVTTDRQIDAALENAKTFAVSDRRVVKARFEPAGDRIALFLADGVNVSIPRKYLQGLESASRSQLSHIEIWGRGTGLHWPQLDVDHYVPGLLNSVFGTHRWMSELGRRGGASTSDAKTEASRANGAKGGRPRKSVKGASEVNGKRSSKPRRKTA